MTPHPTFQLIGICAAAVGFASLQGCATMSEADCLTADWAVVGEVDGQQGRPLSELNRYRRQCAGYDVVPDTQAYIEARERGLTVYCTPSNGYREGRSGARDELVCPAALAPDFQRTHRMGRAVLTSLERLRNTGASIRSARSALEGLRSDIEEREASLESDETTDERKRELREEIDSIERRIDVLEAEIAVSAGVLAVAVRDYTQAVQAARSEGFDEPMESELINELGRLAR